MACECCGGVLFHSSGCPYAPIGRANHYCYFCKEGIFNGEEYIINDIGKYAHWECLDGTRELAKFLGFDVKEMEDDD